MTETGHNFQQPFLIMINITPFPKIATKMFVAAEQLIANLGKPRQGT